MSYAATTAIRPMLDQNIMRHFQNTLDPSKDGAVQVEHVWIVSSTRLEAFFFFSRVEMRRKRNV